MRIEDLQVQLRPRTFWEATDLGYRMVWHWRSPTFPLTFAICVIMASALIFAFRGNVIWPMLIMWWLKPLWDRISLLILSRAVFGAPPTFRQALRMLPRFALPGLFWGLTFRRLSPYRTVTMALDCLEGGNGKLRRRRKRVITRPISGGLLGLMFWFWIIEYVVLAFGLLLMAYALFPQEYAHLIPLTMDVPGFWSAYLIAWFVGFLFFEPFVMGAGFSIYLNRRTILECWDIELIFRKIRSRLSGGVATLAFLALAAVGAAQLPAHAQPPPLEEVDPASLSPSQSEVYETLRDPRMGEIVEGGHWRLRQWGEQNKTRQTASTSPSLGLGHYFARMLIWLILLALIGALIYGIVYYWPKDLVVSERSAPHSSADGPSTTPLLLQEGEPLPDDILQTARLRWQAAHYRDAMSLLYRGALRELTINRDIELGEDATERECLQRVEGHVPEPVHHYFGNLTRTWIAAAYADRYPDSDTFETLCRNWPCVGARP